MIDNLLVGGKDRHRTPLAGGGFFQLSKRKGGGLMGGISGLKT